MKSGTSVAAETARTTRALAQCSTVRSAFFANVLLPARYSSRPSVSSIFYIAHITA